MAFKPFHNTDLYQIWEALQGDNPDEGALQEIVDLLTQQNIDLTEVIDLLGEIDINTSTISKSYGTSTLLNNILYQLTGGLFNQDLFEALSNQYDLLDTMDGRLETIDVDTGEIKFNTGYSATLLSHIDGNTGPLPGWVECYSGVDSTPEDAFATMIALVGATRRLVNIQYFYDAATTDWTCIGTWIWPPY